MKTFFLYLKQGIKGVLKFKIQFIVVIILSFLSTLILTVSLTTSSRLDNNYNEAINKINKFDFVNEKKVGVDVDGTKSSSVVPLIDFINDEFLQLSNQDNLNDAFSNKSIEYNLNLINYDEFDSQNYKETFITKTFEDEAIQDSLFELLSDFEYFKSAFNYEYIEADNVINYNPLGNFDFQPDSTMSRRISKNDSWNKFNYEVISTLKENYLDDLFSTNENSYLENTPFFELKKKGLINKENFSIDITSESGKNDKNIYNNYLYFAFETIPVQINSIIFDYITHFTNIAISNSETKQKDDVVKEFNELLASENTPGFSWIDSSNSSEIEKMSNTIFSYITGLKYSSSVTTKAIENFVVDNTTNKPWVNNVVKKDGKFISENVLSKPEDVYQYGKRGSLSQIVGNIEKNEITNISSTTNLNFLKHEGKIPLNNMIAKNGNFSEISDRKNISYDQITPVKGFFLRNEILSNSADLDYTTRGELFFSDKIVELDYRIVNLDYSWKDKITIYQGKKPRLENEILVNPQFARANKYQLGENIKIGGGDFIISGFAVDPLTYFPVANLEMPLPNNEKSAIIFADSNTISKIITGDLYKYGSSSIFNFISNRNNEPNLDNKMAKYSSFLFNNPSEYQYNLRNLQNFSEYSTFDSSKMYDKYVTFDDSNLKYNFTITPTITNTFKIFAYTFSALICIIAMIATALAIKKTIELNSGEIGILKSMGAKSWEIALSYLAYGIVVTLFVIPVAWVIGCFAQELVASLFLQYVSGEYNLVLFDWKSITSAFLIFGVLICIMSFIVALILIRKPTLEIINRTEKVREMKTVRKVQHSLFSKTRFSTRFSVELAITGFWKTMITGFTIFLASFLVSITMTIPGIVDIFVSSYYKNVNYANNARNIDLIGNAPLAKTQLSPTKEIDSYSDHLFPSNNIFGTEIDDISDSVTNVSPINNNSVFPHLFISPDDSSEYKYDAKWMYDLIVGDLETPTKNNREAESTIISTIASIMGNNWAENIGKGLALSEIQKIIEWIIHSPEYANDEEGFEKRAYRVGQASQLLTNGLPQLVTQFVAGSSTSEGNWKEQILNIIIARTPQYIKGYVLKNESRLNNFMFGYVFNKYIPSVDNMYTKVDITTSESNFVELTGMQSNQNAFKIEGTEKEKIYTTIYQSDLIKKLLNGEQLSSDQLLEISNFYDSSKKELVIPTIMNQQTEFSLGNSLDQLNEVSFNPLRIVLRSTLQDLPMDAWMYDDRDWSQAKGEKVDGDIGWIPGTNISSSKISYAPMFTYDGKSLPADFDRYEKSKLNKNAYAFYDLQSIPNQDGTENLNLEIRPYYSYENMMMFVPKDYKQDFETIKKLGNAKSDMYWIDKPSVVPIRTIEAWNKQNSTTYSKDDFFAIRPYSLYYDTRNYNREEDNLSGNAVGQVTGKYANFYFNIFRQPNGPLTLANTLMDWKKLSNGNVKNIKVKKIGEIEIYGENIAIADQNIINLVNGYDNETYTPFNMVYEDLSSPAGSYTKNGVNIDTYNRYDPVDLINENNKDNWVYGETDSEKSVRPSTWYNGVYSNAKEPYFITTQASFARNPKIGDDILDGDSAFQTGIELKETQFLTQQEALIDQISAIVLTVGVFFIILLIIIMVLTIILINDLYVNQYKKFMVVMKSIGYKNNEIIFYTFGFVSLFSLITFGAGLVLSYAAIFGIGDILSNKIGAIPFGTTWWSPVASTLIIIVAFISSILLTTWKIRKESPTSVII